jgi:integrase
MRKELNENIYLNEEEVLSIWEFKDCEYENPYHKKYTTEYLIDIRDKISGKRGGIRERIITNWELTRDMFIFSCTTGLRYSDVVKVKVADYDFYQQSLQITPQKTNKGGIIVRIPMSVENDNILKIIWEKYSSGKSSTSFLFPKTKHGNDYPNQKLNKILKDICNTPVLKKKLNRTFIKNYVKGDEIVNDLSGRKYLYDEISFHSGRRTFATRALKITNNPEQVKKITGHSTDRIFNRYIGANKEDVGRINKMWDVKNMQENKDENIEKSESELAIEILNRKRVNGEITNVQFLKIMTELLGKESGLQKKV